MGNLYADIGTFQRQLVNGQSLDDEDVIAALMTLEAASRAIDGPYGARRYFYTETLTRYLNGTGRRVLEIGDDKHPDLLSISALAADYNFDRVYEQTLVIGTDVELCNLDSDDDSEPPFNALRFLIGASIGMFPGPGWYGRRGVRASGVWGYRDTRESVLTLAGVAVTGTLTGTTGTSLTTSAAAYPELAPGMTLWIESEQVYIRGGIASPFVVDRGVNGTTPSAHSGAAISKVTYPLEVVDATLLQASRLWKRRDVPMLPAQVGAPFLGNFQASNQLDPDVQALLLRVRRGGGLH